VSEKQQRRTVKGSERRSVAGAERLEEIRPDEVIEVSLLLRRNTPLDARADDPLSRTAGRTRRLSRAGFARAHGARNDDADRLGEFASAHDLQIVAVDLPSRIVMLRGTASSFGQAFGVRLHTYQSPGSGAYRGREGSISVPAELAGIVQGVFGLDNRRQVDPRIYFPPERPGAVAPDAARTLTVPEVAQLYGFPTSLTGRDQCIGILEFGGGFQSSDVRHYFQGLGKSEPGITVISVDGAKNSFGVDTDADGEVALDIEVAGAVAHEATLAVYFSTNTDKGFVDCIAAAVHDSDNRPSIISISWGGPENAWTSQTIDAIDQYFQDAAALGITILAAAGDHGSADYRIADNGYDGHAHVDFPASSDNATACGGTHLEGTGSTISSESVWSEGDWATGGGVSDVFALPSWQSTVGVPTSVNGTRVGRGLPDVAGNASGDTGYVIYYAGSETSVGGTSAVAPLWAGLLALVNQATSEPVGAINAALYSRQGIQAFRDVTQGSNAIAAGGGKPATPGYGAAAGWDPCTGLGTPNGQAILELFRVDLTPILELLLLRS
jgi:kumamolisin